MKVAICNELFEGWSLKNVFSHVSELGYEGVEIAPFTISDDVRKIGGKERKETKELAASHDLEVVGIHWVLVTPKGLHLTHPDENIRQLTKQYLFELIRFASDIGGKVLVFGSPQQRNVLGGVSFEEAWKYAGEIFSECSRFAEDYNVTVAMEPLAKRGTNFINTAEEAIQLIKDVSHPNFRLHLDVRAMLDEGKPIPDIIRKSKDYLVHFHVNDDNGLGPGFGKVDYPQIIKALRDIEYRGFLSVEVFDFSPGPEKIASESLKNLRRFLQES